MIKVISIALPGYARLRAPVLIEHPLLQVYLDDGWELKDILPVASNGNGYLMTFILTTDNASVIKRETVKTRALQGSNARLRSPGTDG